jgi:hypothetical protein
MTTKVKPLSQTQCTLLIAAAARDDHLVPLPQLPVAAARQVIRSMLNAELVVEVPAPINDPGYAWRTAEEGGVLALRATALGIARISEGDGNSAARGPIGSVVEDSAKAVGVNVGGSALIATPFAVGLPADAIRTSELAQEGQGDPDRRMTAQALVLAAEASPAASSSARPARRADCLRRAAEALLEAWDGLAEGCRADVGEIAGPTAALRVALAASASADQRTDRTSLRPDTKQAQVLTMLRRHEGASGPQSAEAMGWAPHTVRGFLAGLAKKGIKVEVLERVRQVGQGKPGAKGSFSIYHVAGES